MAVVNKTSKLKRSGIFLSGHNDQIWEFQGNTANNKGYMLHWEITAPTSGLFASKQMVRRFHANLKDNIKQFVSIPNPTEEDDNNYMAIPKIDLDFFEVLANGNNQQDYSESESYHILDSVVNFGENVNSSIGFMTDFGINHYHSFPTTIPLRIASNINQSISTQLKLASDSGVVTIDNLGTNTQPCYYHWFYHEDLSQYLNGKKNTRLQLHINGSLVQELPISFDVNPCLDGVFLRWKNKYGGFESHLFSNIYETSLKPKSKTFSTIEGETLASKHFDSEIRIVANGLNHNDYAKLSDLEKSAEIYRWHRDTNEWEEVFVKQISKRNTKITSGDLAFKVTTQKFYTND
ncbi:MAG: hypothetical protein N4A45_10345 [Flavobacteriales bacterium]|jgi:hypothetical protein|nr:hypothetical protein [Flavobacteriales bacterium]